MHLTAEQSDVIYQPEEINQIDFSRTPKHVAIIPDGNRRWALRQFMNLDQGHRKGADNLITILKAAKELTIKTVTIYAFSTENWSRSDWEVEAVLNIIKNHLEEQCASMIENGIKLFTIGDCSKLPEDLQETLQKVKNATAHCTDLDLVLALNYGSRDELRRAMLAMLDDCKAGKIHREMVSEKLIGTYLDTAHWRDPELLIRTSGEFRMSNFLLWQISYTEIYNTPVYWPDFTPQHFLEAIITYQSRYRRGGQ